MDNNHLILLSKFSVSARRLIGSVNPARLLKDSEYSAEIFQKTFELGDEALITLALEVQAMLGLIAPDALPAAREEKKAETKPVDTMERKYLFGARS